MRNTAAYTSSICPTSGLCLPDVEPGCARSLEACLSSPSHAGTPRSVRQYIARLPFGEWSTPLFPPAESTCQSARGEADAVDVVTGASSYTGRYIARELMARGRQVRSLARHHDARLFEAPVEWRPLEFSRTRDLTDA